MAYRYTNTDKWGDAWFANLKPAEKLLFNYLCDNCDIAGFIELNIKRWASDIGYDKNITEGALKGLQRGLLFSTNNDCIFIKNFLKHQKNYPLNPENMAHKGIIKRFELYAVKFEIENINQFIEGASKVLQSPYGNGSGTGNDIGNDIDYDLIVNLYHDLCPKMSRVEKLTGERRGFVHARFMEYGIEKMTTVLRLAGQSDFLNGKNDKAWKADLEWIMRPTNFIKIFECKYENRERKEETHDERIKRLAGV